MDIRQSIVQTLYNDFQKITTGNGYNNTIVNVWKKDRMINELASHDFPSISFVMGGETFTSLDEKNEILKATSEIIIQTYVAISNYDSDSSATLTDAINLSIQDVKSLIQKYKSNATIIDTIQGVISWNIKSVAPFAFIDTKYMKGGAEIIVQVEYIECADNNAISSTLAQTPTLSAPANTGTSTTLYPQFNWSASADDLGYHIQIATDTAFGTPFIDQNYVLYSSFTPPVDKALTDATTYYWRVRAFNRNGYSSWTSAWSTNINASTTPATPSLISPTGSLTSTLTATDFHWTISDNSTSYDIIVSSASNFSVTSFSSSAINSTTTTANLSANTSYWWKVRGRNSGGVGDYSTTGMFVRNADAQDYRTNLIVDWIADSNISSSAGLVSSWVDTVSGLTMSQSTNSLKPLHNINQLNGHNVVQFLTNVPYMTFPATQFGTYTIFAVVNPSVHTSGDGNVLLGGTAGDIYTSLRLVSAGYGTGDSSLLRNANYTGSATATGWGIYTFQAQKLYKNNTEATYAYTQNPATITLNVLGARNTSKTFPWFGQIAEIRIYNAVLDATSIGIVNNYLNNKYAIY